MKCFFSLVFLVGMFTLSYAQESIEAVWKTIDEEGNAKSHIKVYKKDGKYFGKIVKLLQAKEAYCNGCPGELDGKNLLEIDIIRNMEPYKDYYSNGTIVDPISGKEYKCNIEREGDKLNVRGYIGVSIIGRTQQWQLVKDN